MTTESALDLTQRLIGLAACITALEAAGARTLLPQQGLLSWRISKLRRVSTATGFTGGLLGFFFDGNRVWATFLARASLGCALMLTDQTSVSALLCGALVTLILLSHLATPQGNDGSDQITLIAATALFLARLSPADSLAQQACLAFIAAQLTLAYFAAGVAKTFGPSWRAGTAVAEIVSTRTYGAQWISQIARRRPAPFVFATYGTVMFEVAFPLLFLLPSSSIPLFLGVAMSFHVCVAFLMGLNSFVFAFAATYPSIIWAHEALNP
ncbi:hypothetical protein ACIOMM_20115 [Streptomyces sp. NPDC087908]|uniref:hypothetical protein n=1 Tax=unclassified Streptomyces TaxID=2593676 RepID=UPI0011CE8A26|nr:hypothetical protein [Streptomyces sp. adm13(2018)]TXS16009.1 hypothetical protein EAO70_15255 [Streptomyces sp. adm13(2018)]